MVSIAGVEFPRQYRGLVSLVPRLKHEIDLPTLQENRVLPMGFLHFYFLIYPMSLHMKK